MQNEEYFSTRDLDLAAVLLTLKFKMVSIDWQFEGARGQVVGYFNFQKTPDILETEKKYFARELAVEPIMFNSLKKGLKSQTTNYYKNPNNNYNDKGSTFKSYKKY